MKTTRGDQSDVSARRGDRGRIIAYSAVTCYLLAMSNPAHKKVANYRARLRAAGLRPIQIWVPDTRSPDLADEARRQSKRVARRKSERDVLDFMEAIEVDEVS